MTTPPDTDMRRVARAMAHALGAQRTKAIAQEMRGSRALGVSCGIAAEARAGSEAGLARARAGERFAPPERVAR